MAVKEKSGIIRGLNKGHVSPPSPDYNLFESSRGLQCGWEMGGRVVFVGIFADMP